MHAVGLLVGGNVAVTGLVVGNADGPTVDGFDVGKLVGIVVVGAGVGKLVGRLDVGLAVGAVVGTDDVAEAQFTARYPVSPLLGVKVLALFTSASRT